MQNANTYTNTFTKLYTLNPLYSVWYRLLVAVSVER